MPLTRENGMTTWRPGVKQSAHFMKISAAAALITLLSVISSGAALGNRVPETQASREPIDCKGVKYAQRAGRRRGTPSSTKLERQLQGVSRAERERFAREFLGHDPKVPSTQELWVPFWQQQTLSDITQQKPSEPIDVRKTPDLREFLPRPLNSKPGKREPPSWEEILEQAETTDHNNFCRKYPWHPHCNVNSPASERYD